MAIALPLPHPHPGASDGGPGVAPSFSRPRLAAVPDLPARRRRPRARSVAAYGSGTTLGFLLAALASGPGGEAVVSGQLQLAGASAVVTALAALRSRAVAQRARRSAARRR